MEKCLSVDWLTLMVTVPRKNYETYPTKYVIRKDSHNTRHFKQIHYIYAPDGDEIGYLASDPHSGILKADSGLLKLNNKYLYQDGLKVWVIQILADLGLKFCSISRLDLALDFERFANNLNPGNFIKNFLAGKYIKKGKAAFSTMGKCGKAKSLDYQTLKFGSNNSDIQYYLYNKTKEMQEVKHKQWIADNWKNNGYDGKNDVWRLEFRLKKTNKGVYSVDDDGVANLIFDMTDINCLDNIQDLYKYLFHKHFFFVQNEKKIRKDRCKPLKLFSEKMSLAGVSIKLSEKKEADRAARIMAKHLTKLEYEMRGLDFHLAIFAHELTGYFIQSRGLANWADEKLKYVVSNQQQALYNSREYSTLKDDKSYMQNATGQSHNIIFLLKKMYGDNYKNFIRDAARGC